ncbi:MAG: Nif3-like dinuclear metal center hexameric protein [Bacteroidetes bacterium]|nr:Nif3-like dinuclear metal center hexameric protein [Bacteroidota bacterium]
MTVKEITDLIEKIAPLSYQESYDNAGLIVGSHSDEVKGILLCLDMTEAVLNEAVQTGCNLIIAHHPIVFKGLKKLNGKNYVERIVMTAIKKNINLYAAHTNLDNVLSNGVNEKIAEKLGLTDIEILEPLRGDLAKLVTYCPPQYSDMLRDSLWKAGSGNIGKYDQCSFSAQGIGTFRGNENSNPHIGVKGELEKVEEDRIEVLFEKYNQNKLLKALKENHPYEEVAYEIYEIANTNQSKGAGIIGVLPEALTQQEFLKYLKGKMKLSVVRYTESDSEFIHKVSVCGGSGRFLLETAMKQKADAFISADFKYHDFFEGDKNIMICDIGHYESEIFTLEIFMKIIREKYPKFAARFTETITNPIKYYF